MPKVISMGKLKETKRKWLYILVVILLLSLLLTLLLRGCGQNRQSDPSPAPSSNERSTPSSSPSSLVNNGSALPGGTSIPSQQDILSQLQKQQVNVTDKVSAQASFPNGSAGTAGTWSVENPSTNIVIMQCDIVLNGKSVAESVPIYPGQHIDSITLSQPVTAGDYDVTATIRYYNETTKAYLGMADYSIHMSVS